MCLLAISYVSCLIYVGGKLKAFGAANSQLTTPVTKATENKLVLVEIPTDSREKEIFLATGVLTAIAVWVLLQATGLFVDEIHPWTTIYTGLCALVGIVDVFFNKGVEVKQAAAGIERLILRDPERQAHVDAAGFLAGYLLGLPCYCFKPDVIEALKMVQDYPASLSVYQQTPRDMKSKANVKKDPLNQQKLESILAELKSRFSFSTPAADETPTAATTAETTKAVAKSSALAKADLKQTALAKDLQEQIYKDEKVQLTTDAKVFNLGRVLVWLMVPVAAEKLKYG